MATKDWRDYARAYFKRFASAEPILPDPVPKPCQITVVIPCHNEPDLIGTLDSLVQNKGIQAEVIVVINHSEQATKAVLEQNQKTIREFEDWNARQSRKNLQFHLIKALALPAKHAGVGLARKIGMDEALRRFQESGLDGTIVCLDADCRVSSNYLEAINTQFVQGGAGLGEMHYEHPYESEADDDLKTGIINYELFLRYYVEGLRQAGFPNAIQTVGSCMLVKASVYAKHGGMNKRKAGEDFYFLHKIIPHESFTVVNQATVYPSCRTSDRVPFGTGKAQQDWLNQEVNDYMTYDPVIFEELKGLLEQVSGFFSADPKSVSDGLSAANQKFLIDHKCLEKIELIRKNTKDSTQFEKQFYIWFDGFMCMKYVHFLRDQFFPNVPIKLAATRLIGLADQEPEALLKQYRLIDLQH